MQQETKELQYIIYTAASNSETDALTTEMSRPYRKRNVTKGKTSVVIGENIGNIRQIPAKFPNRTRLLTKPHYHKHGAREGSFD